MAVIPYNSLLSFSLLLLLFNTRAASWRRQDQAFTDLYHGRDGEIGMGMVFGQLEGPHISKTLASLLHISNT